MRRPSLRMPRRSAWPIALKSFATSISVLLGTQPEWVQSPPEGRVALDDRGPRSPEGRRTGSRHPGGAAAHHQHVPARTAHPHSLRDAAGTAAAQA